MHRECQRGENHRMKRAIFCLVFCASFGPLAAAPLTPETIIALRDVEGRIDHLSYDAKTNRLFVAALGNNTVEVVDLGRETVVNSIRGLSEPQAALYLPEFNQLAVTNGGDGSLRVFDGMALAPRATIKFEDDADNARYDSVAKKIYVGYGSGALAVVDAEKNVVLGTIPLTAHPESFQLEKNGTRIFVNVPNAREIVVIDRAKNQVVAKWPVREATANFPMALDEADHRLFVGCRSPAKMVVFDTENGAVVASIGIVGDADDMWFDEVRRRIYVSGGEGFVSVISQTDLDQYTMLEKIPVAAGARTSFFDPTRRHLYVAVPHRFTQRAEIRIFDLAR